MSRKIFTTLCLAFLLVSCSSAPDPKVTVTSQVTVTSTPARTETPAPTATQVTLNVSPEIQSTLEQQKALNPNGTLSTKLLHEKSIPPSFNIDAKSITVTASTDTSVNFIITGKDASGQRYIWNAEAGGWVKDIATFFDYSNPANSPFLEKSGFDDGSANLIKSLYFAEHPELISDTAITPYYKLNVGGNNLSGNLQSYGYVSLFRKNQGQFKGATETKYPFKSSEKPFGWTGMFQTTDDQGRVIYVLSQVRKNPTPANPDQTINIFLGLDKSSYEFYLNFNNSGLNQIKVTVEDDAVELGFLIPPPPGTQSFNPKTINFNGQMQNPAVGSLMSQNDSRLFVDEYQSIVDMFTELQRQQATGTIQGVSPASPWSIPLSELPKELENRIVFAVFLSWNGGVTR